MTDEQERLLEGLLMQALGRLSTLEKEVGGLKQFHEAVAPRIERNTATIVELQSRRTTYSHIAWLAVVLLAAVVGAFSGHIFDMYWVK